MPTTTTTTTKTTTTIADAADAAKTATTTTTTTTTTSTTTENSQEKKISDEEQYLVSLDKKPRMVEVLPGLFFGNMTSHRDDDLLRANHIGTIVDIGGCINKWETMPRLNMIPKDRILTIDFQNARAWESHVNLLEYLTNICDFIDRWAPPALNSLTMLPKTERRRKKWLEKELSKTNSNDKNRKIDDADDTKITKPDAVLVTCPFGIYHSPMVIAAYLMRKFQESAKRVMKFLHSMMSINVFPRPVLPGQVDVNFSSFRVRQMIVWERVKYSIWQAGDQAHPKRAYRHFLDDYAKYFTLTSELQEFYHDLEQAAKGEKELKETKRLVWNRKHEEALREMVRVEFLFLLFFRRSQMREIFRVISSE